MSRKFIVTDMNAAQWLTQGPAWARMAKRLASSIDGIYVIDTGLEPAMYEPIQKFGMQVVKHSLYGVDPAYDAMYFPKVAPSSSDVYLYWRVNDVFSEGMFLPIVESCELGNSFLIKTDPSVDLTATVNVLESISQRAKMSMALEDMKNRYGALFTPGVMCGTGRSWQQFLGFMTASTSLGDIPARATSLPLIVNLYAYYFLPFITPFA